MADFYLDHDVKQQIAEELIARGHTAVTAVSQSLDSASDPAVLSAAVRQARIIITCNNKDFRMLHDAWLRWQVVPQHFGIIVIKQDWTVSDTAERIDGFVAAHPSLQNQWWEWKSSAGWVQFEPRM